MTRFKIFIFFSLIATFCKSQYAFTNTENYNGPEKRKSKPIMYNSLGYHFQIDKKDIIIGGSSISYKRWGFCVSYHLGIQNFMLPDGTRGDMSYDMANQNKYIIANASQRAAVIMLSGCFTIPITKRIPFYIGPGGTFFRQFFEYKDPIDGSMKWNENPNGTGLEWNYTAGVFVPIVGRLILNVQYDNNPRSVMVGIAIRDIFCYEDIDEW